MCQHCDEIFNFKKSFRKHKNDQHSKKHVKSFRFENNAIKLLCTIEKKSIVMNSFVSSELRISIATSKQIFELTLIFEIIISQKCIYFSIHTLEIVSKSKKNKFTQCFFILLKSSFRTFESEFQEISVQKTSNICSFFSNNTIHSANTSVSFTKFTEIAKIIENSFAKIRIQTVRIRVKLKIERTVFQLSAFEIASKSMKKFSIQQTICVRICKRCQQNFNFNNKFHEHIRQFHVRKSVKDFIFRIFTR